MLRPKGETVDGWLDWEGEVDFFSSRKTKFLWRGFSLGKVDSFNLVYKDSPTSSIKMTLHQVFPDGKCEFQSEMVPATDKLITFILMPESSDLLFPTSRMDKRMLAFNQVETEVIEYD